MLPDRYTSFARLPTAFSKFALFPSEAVATSPILYRGKGAGWYRDLSRRLMPTTVGPLGIYAFTDAAVSVQGRVVAPDGLFLHAPDLFDSFSMDRFAALNWQRYRDAALAAERASPDETAFLVCKPGHLVYGHWLLDMLPQVWLARLAGAHFYPEMAELPVLIEAQTPAWARAMITEGLGLPATLLREYSENEPPRRYSRLLVPSLLRADNALSSRFRVFAAEIMNRLGITPEVIAASSLPRRFYAVRDAGRSRGAGARERGVQDEDALQRICVERGLALIDPATLPWRDQVLLFAGCELVVGPFGSGMHNLIFAPAGSHAVVLANRFMNWLQSAIAAVQRQRLTYIFEEEEIASEEIVLSRYDPDMLRATLDAADAPL